MAPWLRDLKIFCAALLSTWWPLMSSAVFTALALFIAIEKKGDNWVIGGTVVLAIVFFGLAAFLAWRTEHTKRREIEQRYFDEQPRFSIRAENIASGPERWFKQRDSNGTMVQFILEHYGGRTPESIRFEPVVSLEGHYSLRIKELPFATAAQIRGHYLEFEVWVVGIRPEADMQLFTTMSQATMLDQFVSDRPKGLDRCIHSLTVMYGDLGCERTKQFQIEFNPKRYEFSVRVAQ